MELKLTAENPPRLRVICGGDVEFQRLLGAVNYLNLSQENAEQDGGTLREDLSTVKRPKNPDPLEATKRVEFTTATDSQSTLHAAAALSLRDISKLMELEYGVISPVACEASEPNNPSNTGRLRNLSQAIASLGHMVDVLSKPPLPADAPTANPV